MAGYLGISTPTPADSSRFHPRIMDCARNNASAQIRIVESINRPQHNLVPYNRRLRTFDCALLQSHEDRATGSSCISRSRYLQGYCGHTDPADTNLHGHC